MGLLNPIWLWGLTGLMIPVAIHLLSRKDMRIIQIGSLRHLVNSTTRQAIRIRLNAYGLLALRCLIIALLAVLLAGLYVRSAGNTTRWLVVESGLEQTSQWKHFVDSLVSNGYELRRLQQGFPLVTANESGQPTPDYWSLAQQLSRIQPDRCFVISRDRAAGFAGLRTPIDNSITWLTSSPDSSRFVIAVNRSLPDTVVARVGSSNDRHTIYESIKVPSQESSLLQKWTQLPATAVSAAPAADAQQNNSSSNTVSSTLQHTAQELSTIRVVISGTKVIEEERRIVEAAIQAISTEAVVPIQYRFLEPGSAPEGDWLIWLSPDEPPANNISRIIQKATETYTAIHSQSLRPILYQGPMDNETAAGSTPSSLDSQQLKSRWWITRPLTLSAALREQFTLQLATVLLHDANRQLTQTASAYDQRVMPDIQRFWSTDLTPDGRGDNQQNSNTNQREGSGVLAVIVLVLFAIERFIASRQQL